MAAPTEASPLVRGAQLDARRARLGVRDVEAEHAEALGPRHQHLGGDVDGDVDERGEQRTLAKRSQHSQEKGDNGC